VPLEEGQLDQFGHAFSGSGHRSGND
jgi:hypothetical protein